MPGLGIDLNLQPPESGQIYPIDWDDITEFDGPAHELDYDMVWDDGTEGAPSLIFSILPCPPGYGFILPFFRAIDDEDGADVVQGDGAAYGVHVSSDTATDGVQVPSVQGDAAASDG